MKIALDAACRLQIVGLELYEMSKTTDERLVVLTITVLLQEFQC